MNDKQKSAFLKREKWEPVVIGRAGGAVYEWTELNGSSYPLAEAYRIASRRKAEREVRLLRISGFYNEPGYGWKERGVDGFWMSRTEALDQMNEDKRKAAK